MKAKKMLEKLKDILSAERKEQLARYSSLKKVLKSLKDEKNRLKKDLEKTRDPDHQRELQSHLEVITAQRKKGLKMLKELKQARDQSTG